MRPENFFKTPADPTHRRYEALRALFLENRSAEDVAGLFGYTVSSVYSLARDFRATLSTIDPTRQFFVVQSRGRKRKQDAEEVDKLIIELRKKYLSVPDIKGILDSLKYDASERYVFDIVSREGFSRLPRRSRAARNETFGDIKVEAPKSELLQFHDEEFQSQNTIGLLCFIPIIQRYDIDKLINASSYPGTKTIPRLNSILSFLALKMADIRRYSADDIWCMDRGLGLPAGLNVLPKTSWFSSYSNRVTRQSNRSFLKRMCKLFIKHGLMSDTANIDFAATPYWGDDAHLENNWSGTRHKAMPSILSALAQDPESGIITYGDTTVRHKNKDDVALEFLDFYNKGTSSKVRYLVFDSKFTTYENLSKFDDLDVKFLTIRRRGKDIVGRVDGIPRSDKKKIRVPCAGGKTRLLYVLDEVVFLDGYDKDVRHIAITGHGRLKPAIIITNDFDLKAEDIVRKYARRWLVEKTISEQIEFFHLNRISSSMVIKVDFDLTMTILAHNLYRIIATEMPGYENGTATTLFEQLFYNAGDVQITGNQIVVNMKKKRNLPLLLTAMEKFRGMRIRWLDNKEIVFRGASRS